MLLINYRQDEAGASTQVQGRNVDALDTIMALYYIAKGCEMTKIQVAALVDLWDDLESINKEEN